MEMDIPCSVCLDRIKRPKVLPCGHSFCFRPCLEGLQRTRNRLSCPVCRKKHKIPSTGIADFPDNFALMDSLQLPNQSYRKVCIKHNSSYTCFCERCNRPICEKCMEVHKHDDKDCVVPLKPLVDKKLSEFNRIVKKLNWMEKNMDFIATGPTDILQMEADTEKRCILEMGKKLHKMIHEQQVALINQIDAEVNKKCEPLYEGIENNVSKVTETLKQAQCIRDGLRHGQLPDSWQAQETMEVFAKLEKFYNGKGNQHHLEGSFKWNAKLVENLQFGTYEVPASESYQEGHEWYVTCCTCRKCAWSPSNAEDYEDDVPDGLFYGLEFYLHHGRSVVEKRYLEWIIEKAEGEVLSQSDWKESGADYVVVPVGSRFCKSKPPSDGYAEVVTDCWIEMCIEAERVLSRDENPLFNFFVTTDDICAYRFCLRDCVLCVRGYSGKEKEYIKFFAKGIGAKVQEWLCLNEIVQDGPFYLDTDMEETLQRTTHLVVDSSARQAYETATRWEIKTVTKEWLISSGKSFKKADEKDFQPPAEVKQKATMKDGDNGPSAIETKVRSQDVDAQRPCTSGASTSHSTGGSHEEKENRDSPAAKKRRLDMKSQ